MTDNDDTLRFSRRALELEIARYETWLHTRDKQLSFACVGTSIAIGIISTLIVLMAVGV